MAAIDEPANHSNRTTFFNRLKTSGSENLRRIAFTRTIQYQIMANMQNAQHIEVLHPELWTREGKRKYTGLCRSSGFASSPLGCSTIRRHVVMDKLAVIVVQEIGGISPLTLQTEKAL
jgi:hypothetical protein